GEQRQQDHEQERRVAGVGAVEGGAGLDDERPEEGDQPDRADQAEGDPGAQPHGQQVGVHDGDTDVTSASATATSVGVSHGCGARILATWGAKAGDETTTSATGPSATTSPSASTTTRVATSATSSTSWVASMTACPDAARSRRISTSRCLAV